MLYRLSGDAMFPDLPIENLVRIKDLYHHGIIQPSYMDQDIPVFLTTEIEKVAIAILNEIAELEESIAENGESYKIDLSFYKLLGCMYNSEKKNNPKL